MTDPTPARRPAGEGAEAITVGAVAFAGVVWLAIDGGGYDVTTRQGAGMAVWWLIALGLAFGVLPRVRPAPEVRAAALALGALIAVLAVGLIGTESAERTGAEIARLVAYGGVLAAIWLGVGPTTWRAAAIGLGLGAVAVAALAVASRLTPAAVEGIGFDQQLTGRRLGYPLGYWNAVAAWAAIAFATALAWSAHARGREARALAAAALPVAGLALYLTYSRGGIAAAALGAAVTIVAARNRVTASVNLAAGFAGALAAVLAVHGYPEIADGTGTSGASIVAAVLVAGGGASAWVASHGQRFDRRRLQLPRRRAIVATAGAALVALVLTAGGQIASRGSADVSDGGYPEADADPAARLTTLGGARDEVWGSALAAFAADPLAGTGPGTFGFWWDRDGEGPEELRDAHSLYLETLAEDGLPGLVALIALLAAIGVAAVRAHAGLRRSAEIGAGAALLAGGAILCVQAGIDWLWEVPALVVLGLGGAAVAGAARAVRIRPARRLSRGRLALIALAVLAGAVQVPGLVSANRGDAARANFAAGLRDRGVELAGDAIDAEPWSADAHALRGYMLLAQDRAAEARDDALDAVRLEPTNWRHRLLLARVELALGRQPAALEALRRLVELRPAAGPSAAALLASLRRAAP